MNRFLGGSPRPRPRPPLAAARPPAAAPAPAPAADAALAFAARRRPPPRCAALRASARLPYEAGESVSPRGDAARRPDDGGCAARRPRPCGGFRRCSLMWNSYSSGRRSRLKVAVDVWSPRVRPLHVPGTDRTAPRTRTLTRVARFPVVVCTADRLRSSKTLLNPHSPQLTQVACGESVMCVPSPRSPLSFARPRPIVVMYRADTSARHKTPIHRRWTGTRQWLRR